MEEEEEKRDSRLWSRQPLLSLLEKRRKENWEKGLPPLTSPPPQQVLHRQRRKEVRERNVVCNRASDQGLHCMPLQSYSLLLSLLLPPPLSPTSYSGCEEKATTNCLG